VRPGALDPKTGEQLFKSTLLSKGLTGYGFAGMASPMMGVDLPGSSLAFNTTMPGLGALFAAPSLVTAGRMGMQKNKDRLAGDIELGADNAVNDLMTLGLGNPNQITNPGFYNDAISGYYPELDQIRNRYATGNIAPMSNWRKAQSLFDNPQDLTNNKVDQKIGLWNRLDRDFGDPSWLLNKSGSMQKEALGKALWTGAKTLGNWAAPALGLGAIGHAALSDKPYDVDEATNRGYAAAQLKLQGKLSNMTGLQRFGVRMDPTMLMREIEKQRPGAIAKWEASTGAKYQPGWMSSIADRFSSGNIDKQEFYTYDADGKRHYA